MRKAKMTRCTTCTRKKMTPYAKLKHLTSLRKMLEDLKRRRRHK